MGLPPTQVVANWVAEDAHLAPDWTPLPEVILRCLEGRLPKKSEDELSDFAEEKIAYISEQLRNEVADLTQDGVPLRFEIDDEDPPYFKQVLRDTSTLLKMRVMDPIAMEGLCADILKALGAESYSTQPTQDGGVDFIATNLDIVPGGFGTPTACRATVIGQAKRYKEGNAISEKSLREFVGSGVLRRHKLRLDSGVCPLAPVILAFWTTSAFDPNAKKYARELGLWYMDGYTLASYVDKLNLASAVERETAPS